MTAFNPCDRATWPETLTTAQIAAIWQRSEDRIYRLVTTGLFRPMPLVGTPRRWSKSKVCAFLDGQQQRRAS